MVRLAAARSSSGRAPRSKQSRSTDNVRALPFVGDDEALVCALRENEAAAVAAFCDRYSDHVKRVLARVLGADDELADLHHDVFVRALRGMAKVRDATKLKGWITVIAVNVARNALKRRYRRRWLRFLPSEAMPEAVACEADDEQTEALQRTYAVLDRLPTRQRVAFALRIIDGMKLDEVAEACGVSLATIKRVLRDAERSFVTLARADEVLAGWVEGGQRWQNR